MDRRAVENIIVAYSLVAENRDLCDKKINSEIGHIKSIAKEILNTESNSFSDYRSSIYNIASVIRELETYSKMRTKYATRANTLRDYSRFLKQDSLLSGFDRVDHGDDLETIVNDIMEGKS